jgi:hypothetical protein
VRERLSFRPTGSRPTTSFIVTLVGCAGVDVGGFVSLPVLLGGFAGASLSMLGADELEPRVETATEAIVVRFYSYTDAGLRRVVEHTDHYRDGTVEVQRRDVATGPPGYIF